MSDRKQCIKALEKAGFSLKRKNGKHFIYTRTIDNVTEMVTVPNHNKISHFTKKDILKKAS